MPPKSSNLDILVTYGAPNKALHQVVLSRGQLDSTVPRSWREWSGQQMYEKRMVPGAL
jgi:hypothetical protein